MMINYHVAKVTHNATNSCFTLYGAYAIITPAIQYFCFFIYSMKIMIDLLVNFHSDRHLRLDFKQIF